MKKLKSINRQNGFRSMASRALGAIVVSAPLAAMAQGSGGSGGSDPTTVYSSAATAAIGYIAAAIGVVFVAGFAIPVAKKVYRVIKGAIGTA